MDNEIRERLARLEEKILAEREARETIFEEVEARQERMEDKQAKIENKIDLMLSKLTRYEGTVGGILLVITATFTFLKLFAADVYKWLTGASG